MVTPREGDALVPPPREGSLRASGHFLQSLSQQRPDMAPRGLPVHRGHSLSLGGHESHTAPGKAGRLWKRTVGRGAPVFTWGDS